MTTYSDEFRRHWPALLGCGIGMAVGNSMIAMMANLFAPKLIAELGWTKAQFSLGTSVSIFLIFFIPFAGRFADRVGARIAATVGFIAVPCGYMAYSFQTGSIYQYFIIMFILAVFSILTSAMVFGRVIVDRFDAARGMALALGMSVSPLIGAALIPAIDHVIETEGWRTAYRVLAVLSAAGGFVAILLIGGRRPSLAQPARVKPAPLPRAELFALISKPAFLLLIGGMVMVNLPTVMMTSQIKLVLEESGASSHFATWLVSLSAISVVTGRIVCGYILDRAPIHIVSFIALLLPAIGFIAIASPYDQPWVLFSAILFVGLATGAEGDIGAMIISKKFDIKHYSLVYSCLAASIGFSAAIGAIILSVSLSITDSYKVFLLIVGAFTVLSAFCFLLLGKAEDHASAHSESVTDIIADATGKPSAAVVIGA